ETNQQVSDFYTSAGSFNGSLTDRHYPPLEGFLIRLVYHSVSSKQRHCMPGFTGTPLYSSSHSSRSLAPLTQD
ncbi:hypothetical protein, partial [Aeromonas salmonicida]|uniref:hypothetical protein n=1 Tax=Aeromonas salmonicida TaxID=645 RepID=UPI003D1968E3